MRLGSDNLGKWSCAGVVTPHFVLRMSQNSRVRLGRAQLEHPHITAPVTLLLSYLQAADSQLTARGKGRGHHPSPAHSLLPLWGNYNLLYKQPPLWGTERELGLLSLENVLG